MGWVSAVVEQAVAKRLIDRSSLGGIAARPKFLAEVDTDIDHRHPGLAELGIEMLEPGRHLAGRDRGDLRLAQICGPNGPPLAGDRLVLAVWCGGFLL